jgi:hypothetical protein
MGGSEPAWAPWVMAALLNVNKRDIGTLETAYDD